MDLLSRLTEDMKSAMKAGQKSRLSVIRMLLSDVKNIDLDPKKPTAEQVVEAYGKKLRKSAEEYQKIGREDHVTQLQSEIAVVDEYLPKKASPEDTEKLVDSFLATNTFTAAQFGQAMGAFRKQHGNDVDAALVNQMLKAKLK